MGDRGSSRPDRTTVSCTECRRRKAKCDRGQPCSNCTKYDRHCRHERVARTPLTRQYLSEIERELTRTKNLLSQYRDVEPRQSAGVDVIDEEDGDTETAEADPGLDFIHHIRPAEPHHAAIVHDSGSHTNVQHPVIQDLLTHQLSGPRHTEPSSSNILETPPATGDFDWDERGNRTAGNRSADGMAVLTEVSSRGYMGVASGAALLRLADSSDGENTYHQEADFQDDRMIGISLTPSLHFGASQLEPYVDAYFQIYHVSYPIVHEATFRAQFMEVIPRPKTSAWQVLLHIIAAIGSFTSSETVPEADEALFAAAKARLSIDMLETGNITLVQWLTLISNYVQKRNKPNSGYNYLGLAKRMAMGIGLHKEFPAWRSRPLMLEIRRRVYWCLYIFDVGAVITFSRPLDLPSAGIEVELPLNVHDGDITGSTLVFPLESQTTTLYTHVRCQANLHLATSTIYARLISTQYPSAEEMLELDDTHLSPYESSLPPWFQEGVQQPSKFRLCHAILHWRIQNFRILMFRAFVMRKLMLRTPQDGTHPRSNEQDESAVQRCLQASAHTIHCIRHYWQLNIHNVMTCWYALYFVFQACLIPVICLRNEPHSPQAPEWRDQTVGVMEMLTDMSRLNPAALRCHAAITKLCGSYLAQDISQWSSPIQESPQTQLNGLYSFMWPMTDGQHANGYDLALYETATQDFMSQMTGL